MIKSQKTVLSLLSRGYSLGRGSFTGWRLRGEKSLPVLGRTVNSLIESGEIIRIDDCTSRVGETYALSKKKDS